MKPTKWIWMKSLVTGMKYLSIPFRKLFRQPTVGSVLVIEYKKSMNACGHRLIFIALHF